MAHILIVDDEEGIREFLAETLEMDGHTVECAVDGADALLKLSHNSNYTFVLTDLKMPTVHGMEVVRHITQQLPNLPVAVLTAHGTIDTAVEAMKQGAVDYLQKPISSPKEFRMWMRKQLEKHTSTSVHPHTQMKTSTRENEASFEDLPPLMYTAPSMRPVLDALQKVSKTKATVLLTGESGTGKEVAARSIHAWSQRSQGPFVAINCAALSEQLLESELFGHEQGAFTGASERRIGRIEQANGGTFFLDEVGELKFELQAKLLRVLQEQSFERVGGNQTLTCDVRWIAATNKELLQQVQAGTFREDLYHRLAVFPIELPPLRARKEDILPIAQTLLGSIQKELELPSLTLSLQAQNRLQKQDWPGNIRALRNALHRASILADGAALDEHHFHLPAIAPKSSTQKTIAELEKEAIIEALQAVGGNRKKASSLLGMSVRTLYDKLKKYSIK